MMAIYMKSAKKMKRDLHVYIRHSHLCARVLGQHLLILVSHQKCQLTWEGSSLFIKNTRNRLNVTLGGLILNGPGNKCFVPGRTKYVIVEHRLVLFEGKSRSD